MPKKSTRQHEARKHAHDTDAATPADLLQVDRSLADEARRRAAYRLNPPPDLARRARRLLLRTAKAHDDVAKERTKEREWYAKNHGASLASLADAIIGAHLRLKDECARIAKLPDSTIRSMVDGFEVVRVPFGLSLHRILAPSRERDAAIAVAGQIAEHESALRKASGPWRRDLYVRAIRDAARTALRLMREDGSDDPLEYVKDRRLFALQGFKLTPEQFSNLVLAMRPGRRRENDFARSSSAEEALGVILAANGMAVGREALRASRKRLRGKKSSP